MASTRFSLTTPLGRLRLLSWVEGISYLLLFGLTMPLKYGLGMPQPNYVMGMLHGVLFIGYCGALLDAGLEHRWGFRKYALGFVASLVPFGTFWAERKLFVGN